jgi:hypothetical protein
LKPLTYRKYSFQKLTQFAQANNVKYITATNTHGIVPRAAIVSSIQLNRAVLKKGNVGAT